MLKCCFSKQSFQWHHLDLHKIQFYNSWSRRVVFSNEHGKWKVTYVKYYWLMENLITQMLVKILLFVTNKIFREIIVWLHVDLHILHTVTVWQAAELTKAHLKISLFRTNIVSRDFINILTYAKCVTCHRIAKFFNELSEWKAEIMF